MRTLAMIAAILAVVAMVVPAYCVEAIAPAGKAVPKISGTVKKVDTAKKEVTVTKEEGTDAVYAVGEAVITKENETITIDEIEVGNEIAIELVDEVSGKVQSVEIIEAEVVLEAPEEE